MATLFWSNVSVDVQSALATALTITAVTKADPAVCSFTGSDPTAGDYVVISAEGMSQINGRVFRVGTVVASTSFELEGEDSTAFDTFVSGTAQVITYGTGITSITDLSVSGGEPEFVDTTTIHDSIRKRVPTVTSPIDFSMTSRFDPTDTALAALKTASDNIETRAVRFTYSNGSIVVFNGYVSFPFVPTGTAQGLVESPLSFSADGQVTVYSA